MIKLIAIDMDGTLLNRQGEVSEQNKQAISKARQQGVQVVLASGRPLDGMVETLAKLDMNSDDDYVLSYNASLIQTVKTKKVIRCNVLSGADAKLIAHWADKTDVNIHAFCVERGLISPRNSTYTQHEAEINSIKLNIIDFSTLDDDAQILKVMMVADAPKLTAAIKQLPESLYQQFTIVQSAPFFLEFMRLNSNKGTGVKAIAEHLNIDASEVMALGDAGNDSHMINYAGLGVAMGNATDDIKEIADYITDTNNNSGVAKAIEKFVLS